MGGVAVLHPQDCLNDNIFSTPVKSRRTPKPSPNFSNSSPNFTRSEGRRRSPPSGVRRNKSTAAMVVDPPQTAAAKSLVMGQVKILKRGEPLIDESSTVLKEMNDRKVSNATATTTPTKDVPVAVVDRKVSVNRRVLPAKKKSEKEKRSFSIPNPKNDDVKNDDFALSSTNRLGPDPEMVPMKKNNIAEFFFAGSAFVDSPPPSSLPLPGFFTKKEDPSSDLRRMLGLNLS